jgi:hypothetical protein
MLSVAVIVAAISTYNAARRTPAGEYGRLFRSQVPATNTTVTRKVDVIEEGPADDRAADAMLVAPAAREQTNVLITPAAMPPAPVAPPSAIGNVSGHGTTIVGDGSGVAVVHASTTSTAERPVLSGGIFKQQ